MLHTDQAFVLKTTAFQESSCIVRFLCQARGVTSGIVKGAFSRGKKAQQLRSCLQISNEVEFSYTLGKSLHSITQLNLLTPAPALSTLAFIFVSYVHELILYLTPENEGAEIYNLYSAFISGVDLLEKKKNDRASQMRVFEVLIRHFEIDFLDVNGLGVSVFLDAESGEDIKLKDSYLLIPEKGFVKTAGNERKTFSGEHLQMIGKRDFSDPKVLQSARFIYRSQLAYWLNGRELKSRRLLKDMGF